MYIQTIVNVPLDKISELKVHELDATLAYGFIKEMMKHDVFKTIEDSNGMRSYQLHAIVIPSAHLHELIKFLTESLPPEKLAVVINLLSKDLL